MRINDHNRYGDWLDKGATASVTIEKAWRLTTHPLIERMRMTASFSPGDLSRLESYFETRNQRRIEIGSDIAIPPGCADHLKHKD